MPTLSVEKANITSIRKAIYTVNWEFLFFKKSVHEEVSIFKNILMNIFYQFIPNKLVIIDAEGTPWMTERIKK